MRVFVTGHRGFIGQNLIEELNNRGIEYQGYDIAESGLIRPKDLKLDGFDWVIHLGAISSTTENDVCKIMDLNVSWSIELFELCEEKGINFQWASSASVYGNGVEFKETSQLNPLNLYARSKYLLEQYISIRNFGVYHQGFRYFNVFGPYESHKGSQASPHTQFSKQAKETGVIKIFEDSHLIHRDFVPVSEVVRIHLRMLKIKKSGIWNLGTGKTRTFADVAYDIAVSHGAKIKTIPFPENLIDVYQYYTCADISKLLATTANLET
jgi:ADP-L-glycero-D-manno-heptose 6-epimerase